jgi:deoxyadenosine/deoxycytidine kinase
MTNNQIKQKNIAGKKKFFTVEGNIGAGKTTFLKKIAHSLSCEVLFEPCAEWQNINGYNALEKFYSDISRWAFSFQLYAFLTRVESILQSMENEHNSFFLTERSIFADRYVFAKACYEANHMENLEWNMYVKWFEWTLARQPNHMLPEGIIYLHTTPKKSYERIMTRGRHEEKNISHEYIETLYNNHNNWLIDKKNIDDKIQNIPVLVLDCDQEFENDGIIWENMVYLVKKFINENLAKK